MNIYIKKIFNLFNYAIDLLLLTLVSLEKQQYSPRSLLIIRLDLIGDYILFRNFIKEIKQSRKFSGYKITLCGNTIWRDIAELLDKEFVNEFIWIDRRKFYRNVFYKYSILRKVSMNGFEIVINPTFTREILFGDLIVKASKAKERIGSKGSPDNHAVWKRNLFSDKYYTKLIQQKDENLFEFYRNKEFVEKLLNDKVTADKPVIEADKIVYKDIPNDDYAILVPGASETERQWNIKNYIEVAKYLVEEKHIKVVITGTNKESILAEEITKGTDSDNVINYCGKTSLVGIIGLIMNSHFVISNETSTVHIAAALGIKYICVSNGRHMGRFNPYPKEIFDKAYYIYPKEIMNYLNEHESLSEKYRFGSLLDINSIQPAEVIKMIQKYFVA